MGTLLHLLGKLNMVTFSPGPQRAYVTKQSWVYCIDLHNEHHNPGFAKGAELPACSTGKQLLEAVEGESRILSIILFS